MLGSLRIILLAQLAANAHLDTCVLEFEGYPDLGQHVQRPGASLRTEKARRVSSTVTVYNAFALQVRQSCWVRMNVPSTFRYIRRRWLRWSQLKESFAGSSSFHRLHSLATTKHLLGTYLGIHNIHARVALASPFLGAWLFVFSGFRPSNRYL